MADDKLYFIASDISISAQESNDLFLYVDMRMFSTNANGNREGVTERFIDSVIANQELYNCLPLYVDIENLTRGNYHTLGHMYDRITGKFLTTQIGSICEFKKVYDEYGVSLYGQARIPKREEEACRAILDLYALGILNFSFEILYSIDATVVIDGVKYVDADPRNLLTGMAIVSVPACKEATALNLVAEQIPAEEEIETGLADTQTANAALENNEAGEPVPEAAEEHIERTGTMNLEEAMTAIAEKDGTIQALTEEVENLKKALAEQSEKKDEEDKREEDEKAEEMNASLKEKEEEIATLRAQLETMEEVKKAYETMKAEAEAAELAAKQEKAKAFAQLQGLDVEKEAVANAIAELNYEAIASLSMEANESKEEKKEATFAMVSEMEIGGEYGDLLDHR